MGPILRGAGTIALGVYVLSRVDLSGIVRVAAGANTGLIALAIGLYVADRLAAAYRWRILYVAYGHRLGFGAATLVYLQSGFLGAALPATVGGDIIRARLVAPGGEAFRHAISSVVLERLLGMVALVLCAALGLILFSSHSSWGTVLPALFIAIIVVGAGAAMVLAPPVPERFLERTHGPARRILGFVADVHERVRGYAKLPRVLALSFGVGFGQQYLLTLINWVLARALGVPVPLTAMLWMWPFIMLAVRVPISILGFGVREVVLLEFFAGAGLRAEEAVSLGLLSGLLDMLFIGIGGALVLVAPMRARSAT